MSLLSNEGKDKEGSLGSSQDRFQPEWMSNRKVLSSSGHNTIPGASSALGTNGTTLSTMTTTSTFTTGGNGPAPYRPHQNFSGGSTYAPPSGRDSSRRGQHSGGGFESDSFKSVSYRDERQERSRMEKRSQNSFGSSSRGTGLNYTRKQLLDLFKPSPIPPEFSSLSTIASQESLTPVALLPIELQEEEEKKFAQKGRFNAPGGRSGISSSAGGLGTGRSGRQGPGGAGGLRNERERDRGRGPAGRGAGGNKGPAWAFEDYGKGRTSLSGSLDDLGRKEGAFMGFNGEEDGLGALSQQTALLTAQALHSGIPSADQPPPSGSRFTFTQFVEPNPVLDAPLEDDSWVYKDPQGAVQGPFTSEEMNGWFEDGYFNPSLLVKRQYDRDFVELGNLLSQTGGASPFVSSTINSDLLEGTPVGFVEDPSLLRGPSSFPSSGFDHPFPHHELEPPQVRHPHSFDEPFLAERFNLGGNDALNMGGRMGGPALETHFPASNLPWHVQMQHLPPQPMNPQHVLHSSLGGFQQGEQQQHWDSSVLRNMNHLSLSASSIPTGPSSNRREGVFMIDESGQFLPVVEQQAAMGLNTDFHRGNAATGSMGNNAVQNSAYPQLWGNQFEANSYVPVAQQAYGNTSPQGVAHNENEGHRRQEEENFWSSTLASKVPSSSFNDSSVVVPTAEPVKSSNQKKDKQRNAAPVASQQQQQQVAAALSSVPAPWSGNNAQKLPSLKEIQEQEMIQQMNLQQQQAENFAKQQAVLLARQKEEEARASAGWRTSSNGTPEKRILSLAEIQEQEMKEQQKKNQMIEEKRIQQQQAAAQAEANAPRWGATGGAAWANQGGAASLKEIQAAEAKQKSEIQQQQQAASLANLSKKKSEPSINLGSAWGTTAAAPKGKLSLKEIQAAEAQQVSGPTTVASIVKAKPPPVNTVAQAPPPTKSDSSDLFWDVSEEPKAVAAPVPQPKTPTKAPVSDQDFPSLGGKSPANKVDNTNDVQGWTLGQLRGFALIKSQDPNVVASALVKMNNANEMKEYLKGKVPQGDTLNRFVNELVRRKNLKAAPAQPLSQVVQKAQPAEPKPAPSQPAAQSQAAAGGKKKKKAQPVDPRLLGFSVNNTNRVMGEIESLDR
eukprot:TRINITY_DN2011_c0_g1_i1.p1 TRINITY_DN2011_c0_g1~~TRINITY_DN2011_c0_g1_i1.p1  ORF type:complete len:1119 (+),score=538.31 TRINITY_DN2011_c0_g1_i1:68-3424(+)